MIVIETIVMPFPPIAHWMNGQAAKIIQPSFPRKRESISTLAQVESWIPAFAGMTMKIIQLGIHDALGVQSDLDWLRAISPTETGTSWFEQQDK